MGEQISKITKETLVPIGLVVSIATGVWFLSAMNTRIDINEDHIVEIKAQCANNPSRAEFDTLIKKVDEISADVKTLIKAN